MRGWGHPKSVSVRPGGFVNTVRILRNVLGTAGLVFAGYIVLNALPDLKRYIRISTM
jgi:hypothetical protein